MLLGTFYVHPISIYHQTVTNRNFTGLFWETYRNSAKLQSVNWSLQWNVIGIPFLIHIGKSSDKNVLCGMTFWFSFLMLCQTCKPLITFWRFPKILINPNWVFVLDINFEISLYPRQFLNISKIYHVAWHVQSCVFVSMQ